MTAKDFDLLIKRSEEDVKSAVSQFEHHSKNFDEIVAKILSSL